MTLINVSSYKIDNINGSNWVVSNCKIYQFLELFLPGKSESETVFYLHFYYINSVFLRCFRDPIRAPRIENRIPRIRENHHGVPRIKENRVPRIREIGSLQVHIGYLTFSLKKTWYKRRKCCLTHVDIGKGHYNFSCLLYEQCYSSSALEQREEWACLIKTIS